MVRQDSDGHRFLPVLHGFINGSQCPAVQVFDGLQLQVYIAFMAGLVACLDVEVYETSVFKASMAACAFPS